MRPKLSDVASRSGVSEATVSRVMNARPGVAEATRRQVLDVLTDLGYQDVPAKSTGRGVVGIITPELENPIFPALAQGIESRLAGHGLLSFIGSSTAATANEQDFLDHLLDIRAAGAVIINGRYAQPEVGYGPYVEIRERGLPLVLVNGLHGESPLPAVGVDLVAAIGIAVRHLANMRHERIGLLVGPERYSTSRDMVESYRASVTDHGLGRDAALVSETPFTVEGGQAGTPRLLEAGATGIVCANDLMATGAISAVRSWGGEVPADVSVIGFDGTRAMAYTDPPLTTLRQPVGRMASAVSAMMAAEIAGHGRAQTQVFRPDLVIGRSSGPFHGPSEA